jgi:hypothetical protein
MPLSFCPYDERALLRTAKLLKCFITITDCGQLSRLLRLVKQKNVSVTQVYFQADVMESWRINKDKKADMLLQFDRTKRKL